MGEMRGYLRERYTVYSRSRVYLISIPSYRVFVLRKLTIAQSLVISLFDYAETLPTILRRPGRHLRGTCSVQQRVRNSWLSSCCSRMAHVFHDRIARYRSLPTTTALVSAQLPLRYAVFTPRDFRVCRIFTRLRDVPPLHARRIQRDATHPPRYTVNNANVHARLIVRRTERVL